MLSLTDEQLEFVTRAASMLAPSQRDNFLRSIANRLGDVANPTNHDIREAIDVILGCRLGGGNKAFIPPKPQAKGIFR